MFKTPKVGISGKFKAEVLRDGKVINTVESSNVVLSQYLTNTALLAAGTNLQVGIGTTPPTITDTALVNRVGSVQTFVSWIQEAGTLTGSVFTDSSSKLFTFTLGTIVGDLTELGLSSAATSGLQTRSLFVDELDVPTTLTVTAQDQLVVTYTVSKAYSMTPVSGSVTVGGSAVAYTISPMISSFGLGGLQAQYLNEVFPTSRISFFGEDNVYTVDPVTFVLSAAAGGSLPPAVPNFVSTLSKVVVGNVATVSQVYTVLPEQGNAPGGVIKQAITGSTQSGNAFSTGHAYYLINFPGPNFITKTADDSMDLVLLETIDQS